MLLAFGPVGWQSLSFLHSTPQKFEKAKGELVKHLKSKNLRKQIMSIETTDKLTDPQIATKVPQHYLG
jgi:hypothetical protein